VAHQPGYAEIIWQSLAGDFQFGQRTVIIEIPPVKVLGTRQMRFTSVGIKASRRFDGCFCPRQPRGGTV